MPIASDDHIGASRNGASENPVVGGCPAFACPQRNLIRLHNIAMDSDIQATRPTPKAFISYSWDDDPHKRWVLELATRLRADGVNVTLDQWHLQPGDQLPAFMERAVRENDYVLIVCTPFYADRSNRRVGGVGYEGDIMTAEVFTTRNERKFIPIWRLGADWNAAAPTWLVAKYRIDLRGNPYPEAQYQDLLTTLHGTRPAAPPVGARRSPAPASQPPAEPQPFSFVPIRILGVVADEVGTPRMDGTRGSALYRIPFQLSRRPSSTWAQGFVHNWDHPSSVTMRHRPGIASVSGDRIILNGTTIEEVQDVHRDTLILAINATNSAVEEYEREKYEHEQTQLRTKQEHERRVREGAEKIRFE